MRPDWKHLRLGISNGLAAKRGRAERQQGHNKQKRADHRLPGFGRKRRHKHRKGW